MRHNFACKLIDKIDDSLLLKLKEYVVKGTFVTSPDFENYSIQVSYYLRPNPVVLELFTKYMTKFFSMNGHISTNTAKMFPNSYVPEHSDYSANKYGKDQDNILKFHIPIITNPGAGLMWKWDKREGIQAESLFLQEGGIYLMDNCRIHSSVNLGSEDRYWLTSRWNHESLHDHSILEK